MNKILEDLVWKPNPGKYTCGDVLMAGKWQVGKVSFYKLNSSDDRPWQASSLLPGIKPQLGSFAKKDEAKKIVEEATKHWFNKLEDS